MQTLISSKNARQDGGLKNTLFSIIFGLLTLSHIGGINSKAWAGTWLLVDIGIIGTSSQDVLETSIRQATHESHNGLIIRLDTPGGALESTRTMVKTIMASEIPIIVWVGPSGSRAASAGSFITLSAHIASMAPGTNIGAAHPVRIGIGANDNSEMDRKAENDAEAFIEAIAETRQRNVEVARSFVANSLSLSAEEAKDRQVIDVIAQDLEELFRQIHNRPVNLNNKQVILDTNDSKVIVFEKSFRQIFLEILSNPNIFYLLFLCGLIGLGFELTHPGLILPGVAGAISMILALIATSILPINFGALALMILGILFMVAEAFIPSFGALGIGGFLAFLIGSIFLVDPMNREGLRISLYTIVPGAVVIATTFLGLGYLVLRSLGSKIISGPESLIGSDCIALDDFINHRGQVRAQGAIWNAEVEKTGESNLEPIKKDTSLEIVRRKDLVLVVKRKNYR